MGTTQKYSLKWNDFTVNVASTFRDLHSRHDFVDVTLACSDGSTLEAHKVILSSVSTYFRDILKTTPCKHPIIILKDTGRDEASAMLEFAYTGEVNVAQELLPSLLQTARAFRIKGLDKVESPIDIPPAHQQRMEAQTPSSSEHWAESAPTTRCHTPNSIHSQQDVKPTPFFLGSENKAHNIGHPHLMNGRRDLSPPPSLPSSQPPTIEASPCPQAIGNNSRTPPPKRWKRSFDMTQPNISNGHKDAIGDDQPLPMIAENYSTTRPDYEPSKRLCEPSANSGRSLPYPHSMPTSPTMFERGNEIRLAGLFRHHLANSESPRIGIAALVSATSAQPQQRPESSNQSQLQPQLQATSTPITSPGANGDYDPVDYRCYNNQSKSEQRAEEFSIRNGRSCLDRQEEEERYRRGSQAFRPESAPTVLDMSPEESLSEPPSIRNMDLSDGHRDEAHDHMHDDEDLSDCVSKAFSITPDAMGRYSCDECGKIFKHPGSLQHHRHIHRGTHRCPSCGKAFSRRWDMERHLNKSKYGCPANRFSTGSAGSTGSSGSGNQQATHQDASPPGAGAVHLQLLSAVHNTTA